MFSFLKFKWLLKLIYGISKLSGFLFISIDFNDSNVITIKQSRLNYVIFAISFGFSLFANTFDAHLNIVTITQSKLTEIGVHFVTRCMLVSMCVLKLLNIVYKRRFFEIVSKLHWCHMKVNNETLQHKNLSNIYLYL